MRRTKAYSSSSSR